VIVCRSKCQNLGANVEILKSKFQDFGFCNGSCFLNIHIWFKRNFWILRNFFVCVWVFKFIIRKQKKPILLSHKIFWNWTTGPQIRPRKIEQHYQIIYLRKKIWKSVVLKLFTRQSLNQSKKGPDKSLCGNCTRAIFSHGTLMRWATTDMKRGNQLHLFTAPSNFIRLQATLYYSSFYISARVWFRA